MYTNIRVAKPADKNTVHIAFLAQPLDRKLAPRADITGDAGEITRLNDQHLLIGLGDAAGFTPRRLRAAGGQLIAQLHKMKAASARLDIATAGSLMKPAEFAKALAEGIGLGSFVFDAFKKDAHKPGPDKLTLTTGEAALDKSLQRGLNHAAAANYTRRLAATPPNVATPAFIADEARRLARAAGLKCTVFAGRELDRRGFVGIKNVGSASTNKPCLIELVYTPKKKPTRTIVLVGKTITFDSGGLSLKINNGMRTMKYDKSGGMAVLGAMRHIAAVKPDCRVVGLLPAAENMVSSTAYRPDDIIRYANDVTVEVTNTDAEGRLVLADALVYACRTHKPDALIDLATLTGGVIVALGNVTAGLFANDDDLLARLKAASDASGEAVWQLPIMPEHRDALKSDHADITNSINKPWASASMGAAFLEKFVDKGVKWAHLDIAGSAVADSPSAPFAAGPTGFGARLLIELIEAWR